MNIWQIFYLKDFEGCKPKYKNDEEFFYKNFRKGEKIINYDKILEVIPDPFLFSVKGSIRSKRGEKADIILLENLIFFESAMKKLKNKLENHVQFIELNHFSRGTCYAINVITSIDIKNCINEKNYVKAESNLLELLKKGEISLKKDITYPYIFKLKNKEGSNIYVTDEFIEDIEKYNLKGINFILISSSEEKMIRNLKQNDFNRYYYNDREYIDAWIPNNSIEDEKLLKSFYNSLLETIQKKDYLNNLLKKDYIEKYLSKYDKIINYLLTGIDYMARQFEHGYFGGKVNKERIIIAEQYLECNMPNSFKWWLKNFGGIGDINGIEVFTLVYDKYNYLDVYNSSDIIHINNYYKYCDSILLENMLIFGIGSISYYKGDNNILEKEYFISDLISTTALFYFDISLKNKYGEYPVYFFDINDKTTHFFAEDFLDFIINSFDCEDDDI